MVPLRDSPEKPTETVSSSVTGRLVFGFITVVPFGEKSSSKVNGLKGIAARTSTGRISPSVWAYRVPVEAIIPIALHNNILILLDFERIKDIMALLIAVDFYWPSGPA
jgi:hypothetical protein